MKKDKNGHTLKVVVKKSPQKGLGLYAAEPIKKGEQIVEYTGKRITTEEADKLKTRYLFEVDEHWTIDGSDRSNIARYVNHSCDPNCEALNAEGQIFYDAIRDIAPGEELTIDYGDEYFNDFIRPIGCKCEKCLKTPVTVNS